MITIKTEKSVLNYYNDLEQERISLFSSTYRINHNKNLFNNLNPKTRMKIEERISRLDLFYSLRDFFTDIISCNY